MLLRSAIFSLTATTALSAAAVAPDAVRWGFVARNGDFTYEVEQGSARFGSVDPRTPVARQVFMANFRVKHKQYGPTKTELFIASVEPWQCEKLTGVIFVSELDGKKATQHKWEAGKDRFVDVLADTLCEAYRIKSR